MGLGLSKQMLQLKIRKLPNMSRVLFLFLLILISGSACSEQTVPSDYKSEANALCDAFDPATWDVDFQKLTPAEKATKLQEKIQAYELA
jgi:hypothetical protein